MPQQQCGVVPLQLKPTKTKINFINFNLISEDKYNYTFPQKRLPLCFDIDQHCKSVPWGKVSLNERPEPPTCRIMKQLVLPATTRPRRSSLEPWLNISSQQQKGLLVFHQNYIAWSNMDVDPGFPQSNSGVWSLNTFFLMYPFKETRSL